MSMTSEVRELEPLTMEEQRLPMDLHLCLNRCGIMRIGKGYCYACQRLFAPEGLHILPLPPAHELAGREACVGSVPSEPASPHRATGRRPWDRLPRVHIGVASHLPFRRRLREAASHPLFVYCVRETFAFALSCAVLFAAALCCLALMGIPEIASLTR